MLLLLVLSEAARPRLRLEITSGMSYGTTRIVSDHLKQPLLAEKREFFRYSDARKHARYWNMMVVLFPYFNII